MRACPSIGNKVNDNSWANLFLDMSTRIYSILTCHRDKFGIVQCIWRNNVYTSLIRTWRKLSCILEFCRTSCTSLSYNNILFWASSHICKRSSMYTSRSKLNSIAYKRLYESDKLDYKLAYKFCVSPSLSYIPEVGSLVWQ